MAKKNKELRKLIEEKEYLDRKVKEAEEDRGWDRSWDSKLILLRLKKQKLRIKEAISRFTDYFTK